MKICTGCKELKTFDCFYKHKAGKYGYQAWCKECFNKNIKARYYKNFEKIRETKKEYYKANFKKINESQRVYYYANKERFKESKKAYRQANLERRKKYYKEYTLANPEKMRDKSSARRAKVLSNGVFKITNKELKKLYNSSCLYCGSKKDIQMDHIIPISKGGRHSIGNLAPACGKCNQSKGGKLLIEWRGKNII
jgi:5-methylcytosine-specific restriction endonuclease McrA